MKTLRKRWKIWLAAGVVLAALAVWALWTGLVVRTYTLETAKLDQPVRLLLLTDLHSTVHGRDQRALIDLVRAQAPDAVLLSGDIADDEVPHRGTELLLEAVAGEYPCFYVTGNHEFWAEDTEEILEMFQRYGVTVLAQGKKLGKQLAALETAGFAGAAFAGKDEIKWFAERK